MTADEQIAMRQAFERDNVVGHPDYEYNVATRKYYCSFTQGRWVNWQSAWLAGQRYRPGKNMPAPAPTRMVRVARTAQ